MASDIAVIPKDLRQSARNMDSAADDVASANPADHVSKISTAMSGSVSAGKVPALKAKLEWRFTNWPKSARAYHDALIAAADDYETTDHSSAEEGRRQQMCVRSTN
ncbi:excreted virulence factor EspC (type VII ESX diderm) [Nocardioides albertanoniae]|uniref:Excreted virulence factor EspC (Type VII ESX diderm) n=1 Tax=Nocardioides albertanoniae TaxID=1175486 RepID=A0A543A0Y4_9ACTN|nr:type VII secretion target [Nocardioides albertanoniae]TQL66224.1 excreted virulence factor EspC (type VII ESX diderm) [Nocardioides albertanoniae]